MESNQDFWHSDEFTLLNSFDVFQIIKNSNNIWSTLYDVMKFDALTLSSLGFSTNLALLERWIQDFC